MQQEFVLTLGQRMLELVALLAAPLLIPALIIGLLVGMFQAATQINEMTLSFIPKLAIVGIALVVGGPWMLSSLVNFSRELILNIPAYIN
ncbi:hypothetical protein THMIRHAS_09250 [Thiosulfatimonas sediminis]|uniref:Flagellar biosynthetic protein FliQ n=1 Tax=Thiosulfatimonas sediminis TaxID=2675054 RepID=A0A6F8PTT8_9GAMM|nr:flagellar biosynthesis protein FliQ [Thiosulfatimonas sediminis]BBP45552.1 hypothetical protein THMIRHAS_09250 [Thiosulfatimonas sediminis]